MKQPMSQQTKSLKKKVFWLTLVSIVLLFAPLAYYLVLSVIAMAGAGTTTAVVAKVSIFSSSVVIFGILTIIATARKVVFKSSIWVMTLAFYLLLDNIMWAVLVIGSCQIIDELIITPLIHHYKQLLVINKEMDKRL